MVSPEVKKAVEAIDEKLRANLFSCANSDFQELARRPLAREEKLLVAVLARRLRYPEIGLRLLYPVVRPSIPLKQPASYEEKAEYGALLYRLGATCEAENLLREIPPAQCTRASLYLAFVLQSRWAYREALVHLKSFLARVDQKTYDALVASVNVCAGLVFLKQHDEAAELIDQLIPVARQQNARLLGMNLLEISAQNEIGRRNFQLAGTLLEEAKGNAETNNFLDTFFIEKWQALRALIAHGDEASYNVAIQARARAESLKHWESIRDIDWHLGTYGGRRSLLDRVYWGTAHPDYRERLKEVAGQEWQPDVQFELRFPENSAPAEWIDLATGRTSGSRKITLKPNQVPHRLLTALTQDFYKPVRLHGLYDQIFPNEYFSPLTSPGRIHQATFRLKKFFSDAKLPLTVNEDVGFFSLAYTGEGSVGIRGLRDINQARLPSQQAVALVEQLRSVGPTGSYSSREIAKRFHLSKRTLNRYLGDAVRCQLLSRQGDGKLTQYRISPSRQNS